jgi:hypothetical protein
MIGYMSRFSHATCDDLPSLLVDTLMNQLNDLPVFGGYRNGANGLSLAVQHPPYFLIDGSTHQFPFLKHQTYIKSPGLHMQGET